VSRKESNEQRAMSVQVSGFSVQGRKISLTQRRKEKTKAMSDEQ
jgi:hypothetical protein